MNNTEKDAAQPARKPIIIDLVEELKVAHDILAHGTFPLKCAERALQTMRTFVQIISALEKAGEKAPKAAPEAPLQGFEYEIV